MNAAAAQTAAKPSRLRSSEKRGRRGGEVDLDLDAEQHKTGKNKW